MSRRSRGNTAALFTNYEHLSSGDQLPDELSREDFQTEEGVLKYKGQPICLDCFLDVMLGKR